MSQPMPKVEGVSHHTVEARGLKFHYAEAGSGEDVVLCLHGWPQHWYEWRHLMPALADRHRVIALDLRGFGWSEAPPDGYEKENMADDVLAILDELGLERVKLVAHDWGAWIGFLIGLREPQRIERFFALNIAPPWVPTRAVIGHLWRFWYQQLALAPLLGYRLHRGGQFIRRILVGGSVVKDAWSEEDLAAFADNLAEPDRSRAGVQLYRVFNWRETPKIARGLYADAWLTVPTLMVFGEDDFVIRPSMLAGYQRHAADMKIEFVSDCGHFIMEEKKDLVIGRAKEFLA